MIPPPKDRRPRATLRDRHRDAISSETKLSKHVTTRRRFSSSKVAIAFLSSFSSSIVIAGRFVSSLLVASLANSEGDNEAERARIRSNEEERGGSSKRSRNV